MSSRPIPSRLVAVRSLTHLVIASGLAWTIVIAGQDDDLARVVERAKRDGQVSVTLKKTIHDDAVFTGPDAELRDHSILIATARRLNVLTKVYPQVEIVTWHAFELQEVLRKRDDSAAFVCEWDSPPLQIQPTQLGVMVLGGTVAQDGIAVNVRYDAGIQLAVGKRYVLFASWCKDGRVRLPHGSRDIFEIAPDGGLQNPSYQPVSQARTLQRLRAALETP
jgi:hypothetical protein